MDYKLIYEKLISRAVCRKLDCYVETHHIIPKCRGGSDDKDNLVDLTPEEHFVAHQLLAKIYPDDYKIYLAASMMSVGNKFRGYKNKRYGWLKRKHAKAMSILQSGQNNSQSGTIWVYNLDNEESKKIQPNLLDKYLENGWSKGRILNFSKYKKICPICSRNFIGQRETCSDNCLRDLQKDIRRKTNPLIGREAEFKRLYKKFGSMNRALIEVGFPGATSHYYDNAKRILNE